MPRARKTIDVDAAIERFVTAQGVTYEPWEQFVPWSLGDAPPAYITDASKIEEWHRARKLRAVVLKRLRAMGAL